MSSGKSFRVCKFRLYVETTADRSSNIFLSLVGTMFPSAGLAVTVYFEFDSLDAKSPLSGDLVEVI